MRATRNSSTATTGGTPGRGAEAAGGRRGRAVAVAVCTLTALLCASAGAQASPGQAGAAAGSDAPTTARPLRSSAQPSSGAAAAAGKPVPHSDDWQGPFVTRPKQPEVNYPRGEVCPFPTHAEFPVVDMVQKTWKNSAGDPVYAIISGPLIMEVTNKDTGKTIRRDLSGTGSLSYPDPGTTTRVLSGGDWGVGLHTDDRPAHNKWLVSRGFMAVRITESGGETQRELLALEGPYEDLCKTLAP